MALSATLQLRQNQSLVMTPQLMQSIRLLQLTHAELVQYVDQEIEKNPLLEHAPSEHGPVASSTEDDRGDDRDPDSGDGEDWFDANLDNDSIGISERLDASPEDVFPEDSGAVRLNGLDARDAASASLQSSAPSRPQYAAACGWVTFVHGNRLGDEHGRCDMVP